MLLTSLVALSLARASEVSDAGPQWQSSVVDREGAPVAHARVRRYAPFHGDECDCKRPLLLCRDPATMERLLASWKVRAPQVEVLEEALTDAEGQFVMAHEPEDGDSIEVRLGTRFATGPTEYYQAAGAAKGAWVYPPAFVLEETRHLSVEVWAGNRPVSGATVWVVSPRQGRVSAQRTNRLGRFSFDTSDHEALAFIEAPGFALHLYAGEYDGERVQLTKPRTVIVTTTAGGKRVESDVSISTHVGPRVFHTTHGQLRLGGLVAPSAALSEPFRVRAQTATLASSPREVALDAVVTPIELPLFPAGTVELTLRGVSSPDEVNATLERASVTTPPASHTGTSVTFDPLPVGTYRLSVQLKEGPTLTKEIDVHPGDNHLELGPFGAQDAGRFE